ARLAAEQPPHRDVELLAPDVPQRHLDAADRGVADDAEPPERVLGQNAHSLLDVARVAPEHERLEVLYRTDDGARLPLQRGLAPTVQSRLIGLDAHEHPVAHLRVDNQRLDPGDPQLPLLPVLLFLTPDP